MTIKGIKEEARRKLALNMHQAIAVYTLEFTVMLTLIALVVISCVCLGVNTAAAIVMICYGIILALIAVVGIGMIGFAMVDFYLVTYRCKPYNFRRLGDTLARSNITKILLLSLQRTVIGFLLLLCLIVPGVIYLVRTSMANYLLIANPKMTAKSALSASNKVMSGKTGAYFSLCMSLIGWYLLGVVTLGLGFVFIMPYINLIKAVYYKRNLQGDKTVYNTVIQPVSLPPQDGQGVVYAAAQPQATQQPIEAEPVAAVPQQSAAPIDTLEEEDMRDMADAMRDFGSQINAEPQIDIPEVPIAPIPTKKSGFAQPAQADKAPADEVLQPVIEPVTAPLADGVIDVDLITDEQERIIDGTSIVETERTLTTKELAEKQAAAKQAIDNMYSHSSPKKSDFDFLSVQNKQSPDDFVTAEVDAVDIAPEYNNAPTDNIIQADGAAEQDPIMSDSEFDEFLRNFDKDLVAEAKEEKPERPQRVSPHARPSNVDDKVMDRAERIRREREERLNLNKK